MDAAFSCLTTPLTTALPGEVGGTGWEMGWVGGFIRAEMSRVRSNTGLGGGPLICRTQRCREATLCIREKFTEGQII